ncbi:site-specific integrase [Chryseobacterium sp. T20]|uniref:site-specific integrase n=1 Tax=Chryseobacterium sp. T20 TaxID=3395375 RepID=UPI0039BD41DD
MLEQSYGLFYFLKSAKNKTIRTVYVRITIDGVPKEASTKRTWDANRWDQKEGKAIGTKEDARSLNAFLDTLTTKINLYRIELYTKGLPISSVDLINFVNGGSLKRNKVLEEFQEHNDEIEALLRKGKYSKGTLVRYITARSHVKDFIRHQFDREDIPFTSLNYEFAKNYYLYLTTVRNCSNNTSLKYISNFKKIILRAVAKDLIIKDPFKLFVGKKTRLKKQPLTRSELKCLEEQKLDSTRLDTVRDIFIFQCYTGLAYIDAYQLKWKDIKEGNDGGLWIMSSRQKSNSQTDIPLLPKAIEILNKYKDHPVCLERRSALPVRSNQKMNVYLKEIADICEIPNNLNTHKARRTFASTVTLNNGVPMHVVKELLGHYSIKQTEDYAITEQETIGKEMKQLETKLQLDSKYKNSNLNQIFKDLELELTALRMIGIVCTPESFNTRCTRIEAIFERVKAIMM